MIMKIYTKKGDQGMTALFGGKRVYKAGDSWTEGNKLHDVVNRGSGDVHFFVTYIVAQTPDLVKRTDEPAPWCAERLHLE